MNSITIKATSEWNPTVDELLLEHKQKHGEAWPTAALRRLLELANANYYASDIKERDLLFGWAQRMVAAGVEAGQRWEPVDAEVIDCDCGGCNRGLSVSKNTIVPVGFGFAADAMILPDDVRFYRLVPQATTLHEIEAELKREHDANHKA